MERPLSPLWMAYGHSLPLCGSEPHRLPGSGADCRLCLGRHGLGLGRALDSRLFKQNHRPKRPTSAGPRCRDPEASGGVHGFIGRISLGKRRWNRWFQGLFIFTARMGASFAPLSGRPFLLNPHFSGKLGKMHADFSPHGKKSEERRRHGISFLF